MSFDRVLKFGGAALADGAAVRRACRIVREHGGERPIVVVSAHKGVTDLLDQAVQDAAAGDVDGNIVRIRHRTLLAQLGLDAELLDRHFTQLAELLAQVKRRGRLLPAERDFALSFGERLSARVFARALAETGVSATPVDAYDLGFTTDSNYGRARPLAGIGAAIRAAALEVPGVAVVTGFLAKDESGNLTTLGRNGSDLTASVIAEAVGAQEIQFWKAVGGILTADPELVPDARVIHELTYAEAAECAFHGARILHPAAVAPALRARVSVRIRNVHDPEADGTVFVTRARRAEPVGVASKNSVLRIELELPSPEHRGERVSELFAALDRCGTTPGLISADGERATALVDPGPGVERVLAELGPGAHVTSGLAVVAVIGHGIGRFRSVGLSSLELLHEAGIDVRQAFLGSREESQAFLVAEGDLAPAVRELHAGLLAGAIQAR